MFYYTRVPRINHFSVKQQGKKIDLSGICETFEDIFACFPEFHSHKMTQKEGKLISQVLSGCQFFTAGFLKMYQTQNVFFSNKLKYALLSDLTIPIEFIIDSDPTSNNMRHSLSSFTDCICLHNWTSGHLHSWRTSLIGVQAACLVLQNHFLKGQIFQAQQV